MDRCPKCQSTSAHTKNFEIDKNGEQWVIERCPHCSYAGWPDNPRKYSEFLEDRAYEQNFRRDTGEDGDKRGWRV